MKSRLTTNIAIASSLCVAASAIAADLPDWRLLSSTYNTTSSKYVTKDQGTLSIQISTQCAASYTEAEIELLDQVQVIVTASKKIPTLKVKDVLPAIRVSTQPRYSFATKSDNENQTVVVDNCQNGKVLSTEDLKTAELTDTTFEGSTTLVIETQTNLSELTKLQQQLVQYTEDLRKTPSKSQLYIGTPEFTLSAELNTKAQSELDTETTLKGPNSNRIAIDRAYSGGFKEEYYTEVSETPVASYKEIIPTIDSQGRSVVSAFYTFQVKYLPENLAGTKERAPENLLGTTNPVVEGKVTIDTDYYVGRVSLNTDCHKSQAEATKAMDVAFALFKDRAETDVVDATNQANPERVEINLNPPRQSQNWVAWERVSDKAVDDNRSDAPKVVSYINRCTGEIVKTSATATLPKSYQSSQSITVITKNFAGLKALEAAAAQYNETQRGAQRVVASASSPSPRLNARKHFEAVEIHAYKNALDQLFLPQGALAKLLLDQVNSSEAYYTLTSYSAYQQNDRGFGGGAQLAPSGASRGFESTQEGSELSHYSVISTNDQNIPQTELSKNKIYNVSYKPYNDVITILKAKRSNGTTDRH